MGLLVRFILHSNSKLKIQEPKAAMKNTTRRVEIFQSLLVYRKLGVSSQYKLACRPSTRFSNRAQHDSGSAFGDRITNK